MMTANVTISMILTLRSPAICWSAGSAGPPVTKTLTPGGGGNPSTSFCTAFTDSLPRASPMLPARYTCT